MSIPRFPKNIRLVLKCRVQGSNDLGPIDSSYDDSAIGIADAGSGSGCALTERASWYLLQDSGMTIPNPLGSVSIAQRTHDAIGDQSWGAKFTIYRLGDKVPIRVTWDEDTYDEAGTTLTGSIPREITFPASADSSTEFEIPAPAGYSQIFLSNIKAIVPWIT